MTGRRRTSGRPGRGRTRRTDESRPDGGLSTHYLPICGKSGCASGASARRPFGRVNGALGPSPRHDEVRLREPGHALRGSPQPPRAGVSTPPRPIRRQAGWSVLQRSPQRRWPRPSTYVGAADVAETVSVDGCLRCARRSSGVHHAAMRPPLPRVRDEQGQTAIRRALALRQEGTASLARCGRQRCPRPLSLQPGEVGKRVPPAPAPWCTEHGSRRSRRTRLGTSPGSARATLSCRCPRAQPSHWVCPFPAADPRGGVPLPHAYPRSPSRAGSDRRITGKTRCLRLAIPPEYAAFGGFTAKIAATRRDFLRESLHAGHAGALF